MNDTPPDRDVMSDPTPSPEVVTVAAQVTAVIAGRIPTSDLAAFFDSSFGRLAQVTAAQGVAITGPAFALYRSAPGEFSDLEVGFPTASPVSDDGDVTAGTLPSGPVATVAHRGGYDQLGEAWAALFAWAAETGFVPAGPMWEVYVTEPSPDMDPADLVTQLYLPGTAPGDA